MPHEVVLRNPHHSHDVATLDMMLSAPGLYWVPLYADDMVAHRGFAVSQDSSART